MALEKYSASPSPSLLFTQWLVPVEGKEYIGFAFFVILKYHWSMCIHQGVILPLVSSQYVKRLKAPTENVMEIELRKGTKGNIIWTVEIHQLQSISCAVLAWVLTFFLPSIHYKFFPVCFRLYLLIAFFCGLKKNFFSIFVFNFCRL